jgi:hypothetical protein
MVLDLINVYECHSPQKNSIENFYLQPQFEIYVIVHTL